jgi:hypothetical protein
VSAISGEAVSAAKGKGDRQEKEAIVEAIVLVEAIEGCSIAAATRRAVKAAALFRAMAPQRREDGQPPSVYGKYLDDLCCRRRHRSSLSCA